MSNIYIIGGANIDITGISINPLIMHDSNPSNIKISFGGVARNIAENCAVLGNKVYFSTVFSNDVFGESLRRDLINKGIDISLSKNVENYFSSIYLSILDENNDMYLGMSDMQILNAMELDTIDNVINKTKEEDILVIDTNLSKETIEYICKKSKCLVVMDPISTRKSLKVIDALKYIDIFKPNRYEAESLSGIYIKDIKTANQNIDFFLEKGIKEIVISLSEDGVIIGSKDERFWLKHDSVEINNATGGGDAFLSAYISGRIKNMSLLESATYAIGAALATIKSMDTVNQELCDKIIYDEANKVNIRKVSLCI